MTKTKLSGIKRYAFFVIMLLIPLLFFFGAYFLYKNTQQSNEQYEQHLSKLGFEILHYRKRAPYVMFRPTPGLSDINSLGFRSPELNAGKGEREYRIAMLGGSVAFGASRDHSIIANVAAQLSEKNIPSLKGKEITWINAAFPSAVSGQELAQLVYHMLDLDIDLLIILDGFNDLFSPVYGYDPRPGYPYDFFVEEYRYYKYVSRRGFFQRLASVLHDPFLTSSRSKILRKCFSDLGLQVPSYTETKDQIVDRYFYHLDKIRIIADAYGIKTAFFLQPYTGKFSDPNDDSFLKLKDLYTATRERYSYLAQKPQKNSLYADLTVHNDEMHDIFTDIVHFQESGNTFIASKILSVIYERGLLNSSP